MGSGTRQVGVTVTVEVDVIVVERSPVSVIVVDWVVVTLRGVALVT